MSAPYWEPLAAAPPNIGQIDYQEITANVHVAQNTPAAAGLIIQSAALTFDGVSRYRFIFEAAAIEYDGNSSYLLLYENATPLGNLLAIRTPGDTRTGYNPVHVEREYVPTAGTYRMSIRAYAAFLGFGTTIWAGVGNVAAGFMPASLRTIKVT